MSLNTFIKNIFKTNQHKMKHLKEIVKNSSPAIVDVRNPWEYEMENIPGSKNIPLDTIQSRVAELKSIQSPVIFYCRSGNRSGMAVNILIQNGLTNIYNGGSFEEMQSLLN